MLRATASGDNNVPLASLMTKTRSLVTSPTSEATEASTTNKKKMITDEQQRHLSTKKVRRDLFAKATVPYYVKPITDDTTWSNSMCLNTKDYFLEFETCDPSKESQQWYRDDTDGHIKNIDLGDDYCLDYYDYGGYTFFQMKICTQVTYDHQWSYTMGHIVSGHDQKCLELFNVQELLGENVVTIVATSTCDVNTVGQTFNLVEHITNDQHIELIQLELDTDETNTGVTYYKVMERADNTKCLDIYQDSEYVQMTDCSSGSVSDSQQWYMTNDGHMKNKHMGDDICLDYCSHQDLPNTIVACFDECTDVTNIHSWSYDDDTSSVMNSGVLGITKCLEQKSIVGTVTLIVTDCDSTNSAQQFDVVE